MALTVEIAAYYLVKNVLVPQAMSSFITTFDSFWVCSLNHVANKLSCMPNNNESIEQSLARQEIHGCATNQNQSQRDFTNGPKSPMCTF